jgi:heptose I phosphotransferase
MSPTTPTRLLPAQPSLWRRLVRGQRVLRQSADWSRFAGADWPERILSESVTDKLHEKQGRAIARWSLIAGADRLVVFLKRHYRLPLLHGVLATLFPRMAWSPGWREWQHLLWAEAEGFKVPRGVAAGQFTGPWCKLQGFLATEELTGQLPLHQAIPLAFQTLDPVSLLKWKRGLVAELARIARELHRRGVFHNDLYFCHFYIDESLTQSVPASWANRVTMIDLHRLSKHTLGRTWFQIKDLAQLLHSSDVPGVTARDRVRFWKLYRLFWRGGPPSRRLLPLIRWKSRLYDRHSARKARRIR